MFAFRRVFNLTSQFRPILRSEANASHNAAAHPPRLPAFLQPNWLLRAYLNAYPGTSFANTSLAVSTAATAAAAAVTVATITTTATTNNTAATAAANPSTISPVQTIVNFSSVYRPKAGTGDDAHFSLRTKQGDVWLAVLDGVGGWGSAASIFSNKLAQEAVKLLEHELINTEGKHGPKQLMRTAHKKIDPSLRGSTTACFVRIRYDPTSKQHFLDSANVGDSSYVLYRPGATLLKAEETLHGWNFPCQLGGAGCSDDANDAKEVSTPVNVGDIIVLATDGMFDNIWNAEISYIIDNVIREQQMDAKSPLTEMTPAQFNNAEHVLHFARESQEQIICGTMTPPSTSTTQPTSSPSPINSPVILSQTSLDTLAARLLHTAFNYSKSNRIPSPFAVGAINEGHQMFGGKPDDITIVVGQVVDASKVTPV